MKVCLFPLFFLLYFFQSIYAQKQGQEKIDSLINQIPKILEDTNKVNLLNDISFKYWSLNPQEGILYGKQALELAQKLNWKKGIASAYGKIGIHYNSLFDYPKALECHFNSLKINEEIGNKKAIAGNLNNIGNVYMGQVDFPLALKYYKRALTINETIGNKNWAARNNGNIGSIYFYQKKYKDALVFFNKALKVFEELGDLQQVSSFYGNMGNVYHAEQNFQKAIDCYSKAINFQRSFGDRIGLSLNFGNIAGTYIEIANDSSKTYLNTFFGGNKKEALTIAQRYTDSAISINSELNLLRSMSEIYKKRSTIQTLMGDDKVALKSYIIFSSLKDSVFNIEKEKKLTETAMQFEFDKKESISKLEQQKKDVVQRNIRYTILFGLGVTILFSIVVFLQRNKVKIEKIEVEKQKLLVDEKNKEILESITYAKRIQFTLLANQELLDQNLKDYFIFFQPKDIVSGDFYWASKLKNGEFALITADSTGHGVPGAIMSLLNITSIESSVKDGLTNPSEILNDTRKTIIERLSRDGSQEGGKDGMDCSLICFDFNTNLINYAAANNPIWIVRNKNLIELVYDKMPVGKHNRDTIPFNQHQFKIEKGDVIYTLTDGLSDQFGGPKGKKFMKKLLKELLISIAHLPASIQKETLKTTLNNWKGDLEQVDDVCVIGIRV